jgi:hypothetical protein
VTNSAGTLVLTNHFGNLNDDSVLDVRDLALFAHHLNGALLLPPALTNRLDLNQDGRASETDRTILAAMIAARLVKADEDFDADELANAEELRLGTNPLEPDTDRDGSLDGWEVAEGTDPLNPNSRVPSIVFARPPVQVISPLLQDTDTNTLGVVAARPPVQVIYPLLQDYDTNLLGVVLARPPVEVYSPAVPADEERGAVTMGRPPVEIIFPAFNLLEEVGAITVGRPRVELIHPLLQDSETNGVGNVIGRPPVQVSNPPR